MTRRSYVLVALALAVALAAVFVALRRAAPARRIRSRLALRLAPVEKSALVHGQVPIWEGAFVPSPNFEHVAWAETTPQGERIVVDGKPGKEYEEIRTFCRQGAAVLYRLPLIVFASRSGRIAYGAKAHGAWRLVVDGVEEGNWDRLGHLEFSPDGSRYAYGFERAGHRYVAAGGKEFGPYDLDAAFAFWLTPFFSADGKHVAWTGTRNGKVFGVLDGIEDAPLPGRIRRAEFSADSSVFAYSVDDVWIVRRGNAVQRLEHVGEFRFAPAGARYAYTVRDGTSYRLFTDQGEVGNCASGREFWWDDGALAYVGVSKELVHRNRKWPVTGRVLQVTASPDRKHVLWIAREKTQDSVFLDGREIATGNKAAWACFSGPRQQAWIAIQREDGWELQYGGAVSASRYQEVGPVQRSGESGRAACLALANAGTSRKPAYVTKVLVDGQPLAELPSPQDSLADEEQIQFTPDGRHVACLLRSQRNDTVLLVDGKEAIRKNDFLYARLDPALHALLAAGTMFVALQTKRELPGETLRQLLPDGQEAARLVLRSALAPELGTASGWEEAFRQRSMQARAFDIRADGILTGFGLEETAKQVTLTPIWLDLGLM